MCCFHYMNSHSLCLAMDNVPLSVIGICWSDVWTEQYVLVMSVFESVHGTINSAEPANKVFSGAVQNIIV